MSERGTSRRTSSRLRVVNIAYKNNPEIAARNSLLARRRGQAALVIALSMILLVAIVGLAVDGGSMYAQRRSAQNSSDAAALAAAREMLENYDAMVLASPYDIDADSTVDAAINYTITSFANLHGIHRSDLEAYYVNYEKQIVNTTQVGTLGFVPWASAGARGVVIKSHASTDSFFMKLFGWDKVGAKAASTGFMGIAVDSGVGVPVLPIGLFTDTDHLSSMVLSQTYTLIEGSLSQSSGNWGWIDFNGSGTSASLVEAWLQCGFDPPIVTDNEWDQWCPPQSNVNNAMGPTQHYQCADHPDCRTPGPLISVPYLRWGVGDVGWWLAGSSGTAMSNCHDLTDFVVDGSDYVLPVFDMVDTSGGSNVKYHLLALAKFRLEGSDVQCNGYNPPTATPCGPGCPTPTAVPNDHWVIQGVYEGLYVSGGTGRSGDLRHTSLRTVYLDN